MLVYKIRHKTTGLFSTGGCSPSWTKKGKMWTTKAALSNHLGLVGGGVYKDAELLSFEVVEVLVDTLSLEDINEARLKRKEEREAVYQARVEEWKREQRLAEYEKLKKEFGND